MLARIAAAVAVCTATTVAAQASVPASQTVPATGVAATTSVQTKVAEVVLALAQSLEENFVFPDVAQRYASTLRNNLASGKYASFPDAETFAEAVTADLQAVHPDGHLRVAFAVNAAALLVLGVFAEPLLEACRRSFGV